jgi:hypothetical protein
MPNISDICHNCGCTYGAHIGPKCPHGPTTFVLSGRPSMTAVCAHCSFTYGHHQTQTSYCPLVAPNGSSLLGWNTTSIFSLTATPPPVPVSGVTPSKTILNQPSGGQTTMATGQVRLGDCPIGTQIRMQYGSTSYFATVVHHGNPDFSGSSTLIGWPAGTSNSDRFGWDKNKTGTPLYQQLLGSNYQYGYWMPSDEMVVYAGSPAATPTASSNGMACKSCGTFNAYAEPNRSDGSHVCYSCKTSGY